jgi:uncharacterized protein
MKLDGQEESENVEDERGSGGGGRRMGLIGGGGGILVLLLALIFKVDPAQISALLGGGSQNQGAATQQPIDPSEEPARHFTSVILADTEKVWTEEFQKMGKTYPKPKLVLFSGSVNSACGMAEAAVGPFYCGGDQKVYIDLSFYKEMQQQLHSSGDFARAYVVAHEVGHHVQRLLGYADAVDAARQNRDPNENQMSVRLELQADYFAGVWAAKAQQKFNFLENGDLESALNCAQNIGDDTLQKQATGTVRPDKFTHGTSAQRIKWFRKGFDTGDVGGAKALFALPYNQL